MYIDRIAILKVVIVVASIFTILGFCCCSNVKEGYHPITINDGIAIYSFAYPMSYAKLHTDRSTPDYGRGRSSATNYLPDSKIHDTSIGIYTNLFQNTTNMSLLIDNKMEYMKNRTSLQSFEVLNQSSTMIDGIESNIITYTQSYVPDYYPTIHEDPITDKVTEIYFCYDYVVFNIIFVSIEENWDTNKLDFEYMLETFKIQSVEGGN